MFPPLHSDGTFNQYWRLFSIDWKCHRIGVSCVYIVAVIQQIHGYDNQGRDLETMLRVIGNTTEWQFVAPWLQFPDNNMDFHRRARIKVSGEYAWNITMSHSRCHYIILYSCDMITTLKSIEINEVSARLCSMETLQNLFEILNIYICWFSSSYLWILFCNST